MDAPGEVSLSEKLEFLHRAGSFPDSPESIEAIETHFAWVFLSRRFAYKLKKPLRYHEMDFTTLTARRANCELEVALNRRLADAVYIGVVPLVRRGSSMALEAQGAAVEWLVKMHRLPRDRTLERAAQRGPVKDGDLVPVLDKLADFYRRAVRAPWDGAAYRNVLTRRVEYYAAELGAPDLVMSSARIAEAAEGLARFVRECAALFDARVLARRVVDAHGDLRPEHIVLIDSPQIIDCLEFSGDLRLLDTAEEISFLALECEVMGRPELAARIRALYSERCGDNVEGDLWRFYRSSRALVRALLCAWHLRDARDAEHARAWSERAAWYLDVAASLSEHRSSRVAHSSR